MKLIKKNRSKAGRIFSHFGKLSIYWQIAIMCACIFPAVGGGVAYEYKRLDTIAEEESKNDVANLSQAFAEKVDASVSAIDLSLVSLRANFADDPAEFREMVVKLQKHLAEKIIFQISVTDSRGILVFNNHEHQVKPMDLSDREHIQVHLKNNDDKLFISKPLLGRVSNKWTIQFTRPVYRDNGDFAGVIVASVDPSYFSWLGGSISLGEEAAALLAKKDGTLLVRSPQPVRENSANIVLKGGPFAASELLQYGFHRGHSQIDNTERYSAWRVLPEFGLTVIVGQSVDEALGKYDSQRQVYLFAGLMITVLLVCAGTLILLSIRQRDHSISMLAESEERWKFALEGAGHGVWDWDLSSQSIQLSPRSKEMLHTDHDVLPSAEGTIARLVHPDDMDAINHAMRQHFQRVESSFAVEYRVRNSENGWKWVLSRGRVSRRGPDGRPLRVVGTLTDINERKLKEVVVQHMAQHDALTDLPNRTLFRERLDKSLDNARQQHARVALIYFDLDRFKQVNDLHGHEVGDQLLVAVAKRVRSSLRKSDTLARLGGDEFVVLLPGIPSEKDACRVATDILRLLNAPFEAKGHQLLISGSLGIAVYPDDSIHAEVLIRCADEAMYHAKANGRGRISIYSQHKAANFSAA